MLDIKTQNSDVVGELLAPIAPPQRAVLFRVGVLALFTAGLSAALRAAIAGDLKRAYLDPIDPIHSTTMIATALGGAFLGFTLVLMVTSTLLDRIGMRRMLLFAAGGFLVATFLLTGCGLLGAYGIPVYWLIVAGMFVNGMAHGAVEGTINPLVGSLYPEDATHRMNLLHAWWPAGLIAGGLLGAFGSHVDLNWRVVFLTVAAMAIIFGWLAVGRHFPPTAGGKLGLSRADQFKEVLRRPSFLIWFFLMLFTSATELAPAQWMDVALSNVVGMRGILLLVYVAGIQFIGRHFAGPLERRLSTEGLLGISCALAAVGLFMLGSAHSPAAAMLAATAWGVGVCYLWPTMIAVAADRYPRGGAMTIGLIGVAGSISTYLVLPVLGMVYDSAKLRAAGGAAALATLSPERSQSVLVSAAGESFRTVAIIPAILTFAFGALWLLRAQKGGKA